MDCGLLFCYLNKFVSLIWTHFKIVMSKIRLLNLCNDFGVKNLYLEALGQLYHQGYRRLVVAIYL